MFWIYKFLTDLQQCVMHEQVETTWEFENLQYSRFKKIYYKGQTFREMKAYEAS